MAIKFQSNLYVRPENSFPNFWHCVHNAEVSEFPHYLLWCIMWSGILPSFNIKSKKLQIEVKTEIVKYIPQ